MSEQGNARVLEALVASAGDPERMILISGGTVVTMDPDVPDLVRGDVLIRGRRIVEIGADLSAAARGGAIVVDASNSIVMPGFHDTHRHCWQNQLRRLIPDCDDNAAYLQVTHEWLGHYYRPDDIYVGNMISVLGALDSGITTMMDVFHNPRTPEHSDAAIEAFQDTGIRGVHVSCGVLAGEWDHNWPGDLPRIRDTYFSSDDQLLTLRFGTIGAEFAADYIRLDSDKILMARELGIDLTSDGVVGPACSARIKKFAREGLLGPHLTFIHCLDLDDEAWKLLADHGVNVSIPATSDAVIGIYSSIPSIQQALDAGIRPSLSVDVEVCLTPDMFTQMRTVHAMQRASVFNRRYLGESDLPEALTVKDVLELATVSGARANGVLDRTGTLTPGKQADLILLGAEDFNSMPLNNAYGTIVSGADTKNVEAVFVAGEVKKFEGKLVGWDLASVRRRVHESRDRILADAGFELDVFNQTVGLRKTYGMD
ncbi:MAG: amidohydrolase [Candidatus Leucobacter sulfamidivorax]|nr:amidohydrolase [Candidatus Leucobacter sulfamidivorax]